jgi:CheY-like chemotaxis protein
MDDLQLSHCCELMYGGASGNSHSIASKPLILAVDDDEDNLLLLAYALEPLGCGLVTAADGLTALRRAQAHHPDIILLDILMPYMDGTEVVAQLRKDPKTKTIPVIAVTALARREDRERLLRAGFNDYLSKPYMIEDIETLVRHYLRLPAAIS